MIRPRDQCYVLSCITLPI